MSYEQRDNTGSLFRNKDKPSDKHPDFSGSALIDGTAYFIDGWTNEAKDGRKYLSIRFKPKQAAKNPPAREPQRGGYPRPDDDIPPF